MFGSVSLIYISLHRYKGPPAKKKGTNKWVIMGASLGAAVVLIAIAITTYYIIRRRRRQGQADSAPAPFPGPAMSPVSSPRSAFSPALPSTLAGAASQTHIDSSSITHSQRPASKIQSDFERHYAQMHSSGYPKTPPSHPKSVSDPSMSPSQDTRMSWYGYGTPPPLGQPVQGITFDNGSPRSSPSASPPMQPMPLSRAEQNPFQPELQQQELPGYPKGVSYASSRGGKNPFSD